MGKMKREKEAPRRTDEWMASFTDMVTLLMTFFILLFSFSTVNPVKWDALINTYGKDRSNSGLIPIESVVDQTGTSINDIGSFAEALYSAIYGAISDSLGDGEGSDNQTDESKTETPQNMQGVTTLIDFTRIYDILADYITRNELQDQMGLDKTLNEIIIRFKDKAFFASGQALLTQASIEIMKNVGEAINLVIDQVDEIIIAGHTDNVPQNSLWFKNNRELASARANAVAQWFEEFTRLPGNKIITQSYSEYFPIASNDTVEGRSENRRVEVIVTRLKAEEAIDYEPSPETEENGYFRRETEVDGNNENGETDNTN